MFYWTKYCYHGNTAGNKSALNNGFDLFSENPVARFFPSFVSRKLRKILAYWHWSREILTERSSVILCFGFSRFLNMSSVRFQFFLPVSYVCSELLFCHISWNSNERFRRNQCISTKSSSLNFLVNCACAAFHRILDLSRSIQRVFPKSITFNTLEN